ncbi:MAG: DUF2251 domain-containing protein [Candidatus Acidiferrum sp.]
MNEELPELSYEEFVCARNLHWQREAKNMGSEVVIPAFNEVPLGDDPSNFMLYAPGPEGVFAVFEDSAETGWFYLYGAKQRGILKCTHIYNRADIAVDEDVVDIGWAVDGSACGLAIWGEFRAFLGVEKDLALRKPVMDAEERGIPSSDWPAGFDRYLEKKID